jgi:hypothetical protein
VRVWIQVHQGLSVYYIPSGLIGVLHSIRAYRCITFHQGLSVDYIPSGLISAYWWIAYSRLPYKAYPSKGVTYEGVCTVREIQKNKSRKIARETPFHLALHMGQVDDARMLVGCGTDLTVQNNDGWTPLHLSSYCSTLGALWRCVTVAETRSLFKRVGSNKGSTDEDELITGGRAGMRSALAASDNARTTLFKFKKGRGMVSLVE